MLHFDSYEYVKKFEQVGISEEQAVVIIKLMQENHEEELKNYVTTDRLATIVATIEKDINSMKTDIALMKQDISGIKQQMNSFVTKDELKSGLNELRAEIKDQKAEIKDQKSEILKWMFGMFLTTISILSAIAFKIFLE